MLFWQIFEGSSHVNVSHIIHDLSFGPKYPGLHNPLDGTSRILRGTSGTFKYFIKVWAFGYLFYTTVLFNVLRTTRISIQNFPEFLFLGRNHPLWRLANKHLSRRGACVFKVLITRSSWVKSVCKATFMSLLIGENSFLVLIIYLSICFLGPAFFFSYAPRYYFKFIDLLHQVCVLRTDDV